MRAINNNHLRPTVDATRSIDPSILYVGTPVALVTTLNENGRPNIGPISSVWALGWTLLLGLIAHAKTAKNLQREKECVVNLASEDLVDRVEKLAPLTGNNPVPPEDNDKFRFEANKFNAASLTEIASEEVRPPRIAECPLQFEAKLRAVHPIGLNDKRVRSGAFAIEVEVVRVHAFESIIIRGRHIDPARWRPLIYNFRHYFGLGGELAKTFRAEY
jgi:flavin reductase (DIM6/NTAB) family NADH-FMN oxidoreductase RutF